MIRKFKEIYLLKEYILNKEKDIERHNKKHKVESAALINGRRLTNIGTYRAYVKFYLKNHHGLHQNMIQIVRQLPRESMDCP